MKIAFIGTHCVGKTTALWYTGSRLKMLGFNAVEILPEVARICPYPINEQSKFESGLWIITEQMRTEYQMTSRSARNVEPIVLSDRSVLDQLAYSIVCYPKEKTFLVNVGFEWISIEPYDLLIYFPISSWKPIDDGVRSLSIAFQKKVDRHLQDLLSIAQLEYGVRIQTVEGETRVKRTFSAFSIVYNYLKCERSETR